MAKTLPACFTNQPSLPFLVQFKATWMCRSRIGYKILRFVKIRNHDVHKKIISRKSNLFPMNINGKEASGLVKLPYNFKAIKRTILEQISFGKNNWLNSQIGGLKIPC